MMRDKAFDLLYQSFNPALPNTLWFVDENLIPEHAPAAMGNTRVIANRYHIHRQLLNAGWHAEFSDFDCQGLAPGSYDQIYLRIPKEKALAHYLINTASRLLAPTGSLILSGLKQEGIKGFFDRADTAGAQTERWKLDKETWAAAITFTQPITLDDKDYTALRPAVADTSFSFISKPGVYGWNKIDQGSQLLIEHLCDIIGQSQPQSALDIGCGYGYLSLHTGKMLSIPVTATDTNAAAIECCTANATQSNVNISAVADDCARHIDSVFDLVVCNPPFHSGFGVESQLTDRFLASAAQHLTPDGQAIFVTNLHIGIEKKAADYFSIVDTPVQTNHFKLIHLRLPKKSKATVSD
ncbi:methyltransferase [Neptunomonas phycophila]|uniref:methyltransferase n=1 Tax=Neptunomonas phycophila TaxID=1572645 RepID=UPI0009FB71F1|nr:methyltransferase [Neptunomonas phycophila]